MFANFGKQLYDNILANGRYMLYLNGLSRSLLITAGALLFGMILGSLTAIIKVYAQDSRGTRVNIGLRLSAYLSDFYITVIRGTPVMVQLLIIYYFVFASAGRGTELYIAIFAFGLNSGAYVSEIVRAGIMAVDRGQTEAGRSLGLTANQTMRFIILPQAIKNILPALGNESIVLFKETAIVGYIAIQDLTKAADLIRSRTFSPVPLLTAAFLYLVVVLFMSWGLRVFERRLARSDYRAQSM